MHPRGPPVPPPPPPPPVLPPPPPPPPLSHHGPGLFGKGDRRRSRMRNFNWETLPKHSVIGKHNIWTADKDDGEYELDTAHMEELFSHNQGQQHPRALNRQSLRGLPVSGSGTEMVSILSSKRSMNVGIFLKQFKRPIRDMIYDIKSGNGHSFGFGKLRELCKLLPDDGEVKELLKFKGDPSALSEADLFMLMMVKTPSYEERLNCLVLKEEFFPLVDELKEFLGTLTAAGRELLECENLHSVIRLVLKTGNYMNAGGYAGSAIGFRMSSLLKLADTKANKPGMNLMHYVVMQAQKADEALLHFPKQLKHIESAARINNSDVEAEFERLVKKIQDAKADSEKEEDLKTQMVNFLKEAEVCLEDVEMNLDQLQTVSDTVAEYFCEDSNKFKLDECCSIFHSFCEKFMKAMQENKAREMTEMKQKHRDRLQNPAKRRSTATCSSRDKEMKGIALEYVLQSLLTDRIPGRKSGKFSPANGSPINGSISEISSLTELPSESHNQRDTYRVKGMCTKEWNSAVDLTGSFSPKEERRHLSDSKVKGQHSNEEEDSEDLPHQRAPSITSSARSSSTTPNEENDLQDNSEEEAQKLREASKKVWHFQNGVSSEDLCLEKPKEKSTLRRHLTFDEETQRYPGDPTNEELVQFLLGAVSPSKRNLSRRHTLPTNTSKNTKEENNLQTQTSVKSPNHLALERQTPPGESVGHTLPVFNFTDNSDNPRQSGFEGNNSLSTEETNDSSSCESEGVQQSQSCTESIESHLQVKSESVPQRNDWFKNETSGVFFSFLKRLGDLSKMQYNKETIHKSVDSGV
uniref:FH2 domain-containing protein 1 n=1 Tax=Oryzias latipes TaxID=8090 RepID=A0A3P9KVP7_ORYLA